MEEKGRLPLAASPFWSKDQKEQRRCPSFQGTPLHWGVVRSAGAVMAT